MVVFTGCTVVLALVIRQGIMLVDNIALTQELAQKENHFRSLVQGSSDVIMIAAPTGTLRYVSPAAAGVYGREAEELIGTELATLIHPDDLGRVVHEVRRFLAAPPRRSPPPASSAGSSRATATGSTSSPPSTGTRAGSSSTAATSPSASGSRPSSSTAPSTTPSPTSPTAPCSPAGSARR